MSITIVAVALSTYHISSIEGGFCGTMSLAFATWSARRRWNESKADLNVGFPTRGHASSIAVTGHGGCFEAGGTLTSLATMSMAVRVASDAPRLSPVTVMLVTSSLCASIVDFGRRELISGEVFN